LNNHDQSNPIPNLNCPATSVRRFFSSPKTEAIKQMTILGLDIGGANIKAADESGRTISRPFAIWRQHEQLKNEILSILSAFPQTERLVLTMTAELADCFSTKSEGVRFIVDAVETSIDVSLSSRGVASKSSERSQRSPLMIWTTGGCFVNPDEARESPMLVAAANWHALATWSMKLAPGETGVLIDIGTTTTDIIPFENGKPVPQGLTDVGRLQSGELSYSGVRRTPLCAVAHSVPWKSGYCSLAAEVFATTLDVHLLLGDIAEDAHDLDTANGKPATKQAAHDRIARMLCCDRDEVSFEQAVQIAMFLADVQRQRLAGSLERVISRLSSVCSAIILSGSGSFLARQLILENRKTWNANVISLTERFSPGIAEAACAYAVAQLGSYWHR
jgi:(4-(4-[2-(gamma-L-glutamylamino)ethyl]phenoxymethyl)furan-2-yl)methanamine synthase